MTKNNEPQIHFSQYFQRKLPLVTQASLKTFPDLIYNNEDGFTQHDSSVSIPVWVHVIFLFNISMNETCEKASVFIFYRKWNMTNVSTLGSGFRCKQSLHALHVSRETAQQARIGTRDLLCKSSLYDKWRMTGPVFTKHLLWLPASPTSCAIKLLLYVQQSWKTWRDQ